jgi:hypothetical protein
MGESEKTTPDEQVRALFGEAEKRTASAIEQLVHRDSFGELLARTTENVMGLTRIGFDVLDLTVRNLRLAGRPDLIRLGRQLARSEDKLELVLQEVERLQEQVRELEAERDGGTKRGASASRRSASSSGRGGSSSGRGGSSSGRGASSSNGSQSRSGRSGNRRSRSGNSRRKSSKSS